MKQALISPFEFREGGFRIAEVSDSIFPVAQPMFWVECDDSVVADLFWYDPVAQTISEILIPEPPVDQPVVVGAQTL